MTQRHFCTYFDHRYLSVGLTLYASLVTTCPDFTLWVLALDIETELHLTRAALPGLRVVPLSALESFDPELHACRDTRSQVEYYFTCSPCLPRYLLQNEPSIHAITYLDSDLFFFSSPEPLFAELAGCSVGIVPHRFSPPAAQSHARFGRFNVGWLTFVRNDAGLACVDWWRERCIEWCYDRAEPDRYADQKYLDRFAQLFTGIHVINHPGANLAPWNVANYTVTQESDTLSVDGQPLIFFHFQGLRRLVGRLYDSNLGGYGARLTPVLRDRVFRPYIKRLSETDAFMRSIDAVSSNSSGIRRQGRGPLRLRYAVGRAARTILAAASGNLVRF